MCMPERLFLFFPLYVMNTTNFAQAGEFDDVLDRSSSNSLTDTLEDIQITYKGFRSSSALESNGSIPPEKFGTLLEVEDLILKTPSESTLIRDLLLTIKERDNLLVRRPLNLLIAILAKWFLSFPLRPLRSRLEGPSA